MRPRSRRLLTLVVVPILMVTVAVSGAGIFVEEPAVGTADGASITECGSELTEYNIGLITGDPDAPSLSAEAVNDCTPYSTQDPTNLSKQQGYQQAVSIKDTQSNFATYSNNRLEGLRTLATMEGKYVGVEELNNGSGAEIAKFEANETIREIYANFIRNAISQWGDVMAQLKYLDTSTPTEIRLITTGTVVGPASWTDVTFHLDGAENVTIPMPANSDGRPWGPFQVADFPGNILTDVTMGNGFSNTIMTAPNLEVKNPDTSSWKKVVGAGSFPKSNTVSAAEQFTNTKQDVAAIIDGIYAEYQQGDLGNYTDALSAIELAHNAGTQLNKSGGNQYAAIQLAMLGHHGDLQTTATVTTNRSQATYHGHIFYVGDESDLSGSLKAGTTYDTAALSGSFVMAVQGDDGEAWVERFGEGTQYKVTIEELRHHETGDSINSTKLNQYSTESNNVSLLRDQLAALQNASEFYDEQRAAGGGGGSSLSLSPEAAGAGAVVLLVVGAAVARNRGGSGGRGGRRGGRR